MKFTLVLRRIHLYLALFLTPWMAMYALSTVVFNHYQLFERLYAGKMDQFLKQQEVDYRRTFPASTPRREVARAILRDLKLEGDFQLDPPGQEQLRLTRLTPFHPTRISYLPAEHKLVVERQAFHAPGFLTRLHSRLGYGSSYKAGNFWAASVDLTILATILWVLTGFWIWWELKVTRCWGLFSALLGVVLFGLFLVLS